MTIRTNKSATKKDNLLFVLISVLKLLSKSDYSTNLKKLFHQYNHILKVLIGFQKKLKVTLLQD